jgi:hypothetical protein
MASISTGRAYPASRAFGTEEVLQPQPCGRGVRGVLVDRLRVVQGEAAVEGDRDPPVDAFVPELIGVTEVEEVPSDTDGRPTRLDPGRRGLNGVEVAPLAEVAEEVDTWLDVAERPFLVSEQE